MDAATRARAIENVVRACLTEAQSQFRSAADFFRHYRIPRALYQNLYHEPRIYDPDTPEHPPVKMPGLGPRRGWYRMVEVTFGAEFEMEGERWLPYTYTHGNSPTRIYNAMRVAEYDAILRAGLFVAIPREVTDLRGAVEVTADMLADLPPPRS
jgi:hypothetical protein